MLLLKFLQTLIKALNSKGGPGEIALGMAIGLAFGLTPLMSLHNIVVLTIAMLTTVSFPGVMLGWAFAIPLGFALDPLFHRIGMALLTTESLTPLFIWIVNTPIISLSRFNNSIVLGSFVFWLVSIAPAYFLFRWLVVRYRADIYARVQKIKLFQMIKASKLWSVYEMFRPS